MKRTLIALGCLLLFALPAFGQGGILNDSVLRADGKPAIGATVRVCTEAASGIPCSPTASIFSDKALTIGIGPTLAVDSAAAYTYYASPGFYKEQLCLGATCVTRTVLMPADVGNFNAGTVNNIIHVDTLAGADAGFKIAACIAALPSTGGICDARGIIGAQVISSTITVNKAVQILLGYATYTTSASPAFDFVVAGDYSSLIGVNKGATTVGGTRIIAASSGVTPLIRVAGTDGSNRVTKIELKDFAVEGTDTLDGQTGIFFNFFTDITLERMQFTLLGQAEDIDAGARIVHTNVSYDRVGTGGTPATAGIRVENRSDPGGTQLNQINWFGCIWQGDNAGGNNKQGTAIYVNSVEANTIWIVENFMDFNATNPDFPIIVFDETQFVHMGSNTIAASSIVTAAAVVDITGDGSNRAANVMLYNNRISFSDTVPAVRFDFGNNNYLVGGILRGAGSGTAVSVTANHQAGSIGPFQMGSTDTPVSNSSANVVTLFQEQSSLTAWYMPEGLAVGAAPATTGDIRLSSLVGVQSRNAADSGNVAVISLDANDDVALGNASGAEVRVLGQLGFGNVSPQATGIIGPNNECYQSLDVGSAAVCVAIVDSSDVLRLGDDSDLASIVLGRAAVPVNALEGAVSNLPRWIFKQVDHTDMTAAATAATFTLWTLPANTMIHDVVGSVVTAWEAAVGLSAAVCSVGTAAGGANDLTLDDDFFAAATVYELHDGTASGGKGTLLFDSTDKFAPFMLVASGDIEIQCDLTGDDHADTNAGQARIYILVSQPLGNTTTEAN